MQRQNIMETIKETVFKTILVLSMVVVTNRSKTSTKKVIMFLSYIVRLQHAVAEELN